MAEIIREIPSTHRPDKTVVFVPERREARLKRKRRNRRALTAALISCAILGILAVILWRANERKQAQAEVRKLGDGHQLVVDEKMVVQALARGLGK